MSSTTFIYALCEPGSRKIRYIGKADCPELRLKEHLRTSLKLKTYLGNWLRRVVKSGKIPNLITLKKVSERSWKTEECRYIAAARMLKIALVNATDGGEGVTMTSETRKKISAANKGRSHSAAHRLAIRAAKLGKRGRTGSAHNLFGVKLVGASSKFLGVSRDSRSGGRKSWRARICGKHFGCFPLEIDAAKAYDRAVRKIYGREARTNFPIKYRD